MDAVYLLPDAALYLVLLRLVIVNAHHSCPREFFFLVSWWTYSLLSLHSQFPAAGHVVALAGALPLVQAATRELLSGALSSWAAPALALCAAGALASQIAARWGGSPELAWIVVSWWLAALFGGALLVGAFKRSPTGQAAVLRAGIGAYLVLYGGGAALAAAFGSAAWIAGLALVTTALWLALAWGVEPTPDALINENILALSPCASLSPGLETSTPPKCRRPPAMPTRPVLGPVSSLFPRKVKS